MNRRSFLSACLAAAVAPAYVKFGSLMVPRNPVVSGWLTEEMLEDMCIKMMQATNDRGLKISLLPRVLLVPPREYAKAIMITPPFIKVEAVRDLPSDRAYLLSEDGFRMSEEKQPLLTGAMDYRPIPVRVQLEEMNVDALPPLGFR